MVESAPLRAKYHDADYFVDEVRREALQIKSVGSDLNQGGYYMRTTLDPRLQTAARIALMDGLETYDHRHGWRGAWGHVAKEPGWQQATLASSPPSERRKWLAALVTSVHGGEVRVQTAATNEAGQIVPADVAWANAGRGSARRRPGLRRARGWRRLPPAPGAPGQRRHGGHGALQRAGCWPWSAATVSRCRTSIARPRPMRQPGSSFKPFVYATALRERQFTPASIVWPPRSPCPAPTGQVWSPENYERGVASARMTVPPRAGAVAQHHDGAHRPAGRDAQDRRHRQARSAWSTTWSRCWPWRSARARPRRSA